MTATLENLLDVMREHGWSDTGPDHDAARWLKETLGDREELEGSIQSLEDELDETEAKLLSAEMEIEQLKAGAKP